MPICLSSIARRIREPKSAAKAAASVAAVLLPATMVHAASQVCPQRNLLEEFRKTQPAVVESVLKELAATPNADSLFWKIEAPGGGQPSWLMGTVHVTDPRVTEIKTEIKDKLVKADVVVFELKEIDNRQGMGRAALRHPTLIAMPEGKSLWDLIPDEKETAIREHPSLLPGQADTLFAYQPWVVATMISVPPCERDRQTAGLATLDEKLAMQAQLANIPIAGLETLEEQLGAFAGMPMPDQADFLMATANMGKEGEAYFLTVVDLYLARQAAAYIPLAKATQPQMMSSESLKALAYFESELIDKRNRLMAGRAKAHLDKGNAFIAVGALHLPGKTGLVELLRQAGYKVTNAE